MFRIAALLLLAAFLLGCIAWLRGPEYDEAYSIFLTAGDARPSWPAGVFTPSAMRGFYAGHASLAYIAAKLKSGDVHPPLYFWALEIWRRGFGPSWFAARLLSAGLSLCALALIAWLAAMSGRPILPAMALALLSYGFAYTGITARGFALAQFFDLLGVALSFRGGRAGTRTGAFAAGLAFGAAAFSNYLAIFTCLPVLAWLGRSSRRGAALACAGLAPFLALCAPYFLAQRNSRIGQFAPFSLPHALALLAKDSGAAIFGGLPLYAGGAGRIAASALLALLLVSLAAIARRRQTHDVLFAAFALATPCGLLALGFIFHNTPIEIRYLAFSLPYLALLLAPLPRPLLVPVLGLQAAAIFGLACAPLTQQPQARAAHMAAHYPEALVLLPYGNDGVGIPGPFIAAAPDAMKILLLHPGTPPDTAAREIILVTIGADAASRRAIAQALAEFGSRTCDQTARLNTLLTKISNRCAHQQP